MAIDMLPVYRRCYVTACFPPAPSRFVVGWASRSGAAIRHRRTNSKGPSMILQIIHLIDIYTVVLVLSIVMLAVAVYVLGVASGWQQCCRNAVYQEHMRIE